LSLPLLPICLLQMPPLLFRRHAVSDRPSKSNFVTSALPGCFAGMLHVLSLIFLVSYSMYLIGLLRIALLNAGVKLISLTREHIPFLVVFICSREPVPFVCSRESVPFAF